MTTEAAATALWAKWGHVFAGAFGIAITLAWMRTMDTRQVVIAACSGTVLILWGTPVAMEITRGYLPTGLSLEVMDAITGLTGAAMGAGGIYFFSGLMRIGENFSRDPWAILDRLRGRTGEGGP